MAQISSRQDFYPKLQASAGSSGEESAYQYRRPGFDPWVKKIPWRRECLPTPVFLPAEFHGQESLVGYSTRGHSELGTTERLTLHFLRKDDSGPEKTLNLAGLQLMRTKTLKFRQPSG